MDFDRLTITLLEIRDDAPELTPEQEDALQDAHMAHLADLHEAGHLLAAGPLLDRRSPFRGLSILSSASRKPAPSRNAILPSRPVGTASSRCRGWCRPGP